MLEYSLLQAPKEKNIFKHCKIYNLPIPDKIRNAPKLLPGLDIFFNAFQDLRQFGFDEHPIKWPDVNSYCEHNEISGMQRHVMFMHIAEMDKKYLSIMSKNKTNGKTQ